MTNIQFIEANKIVDKLTDNSKEMLSIFLPFGIPGKSDEKMRIHRKNTISELEKAISEREPVAMEMWGKVIRAIQEDEGPAFEDLSSSLPATAVYFSDGQDIMKTYLYSYVRPHFSLDEVAEVEPLVYRNWAVDDFVVIGLDLENFQMWSGSGNQIRKHDVVIPGDLIKTVGEQISDFGYEAMMETADRNRNPKTDLDKRNVNNLHGMSSRQQTHRDKNLDFWLKKISELVDENIKSLSNGSRPEIYVVGVDYLVNDFLEMNSQWSMKALSDMSAEDLKDPRKICEEITASMATAKLAGVDQELQPLQPTEDLEEIEEKLMSGQVKNLYFHQDDWMTMDPSGEVTYSVHNERVKLLQKALKLKVSIGYTHREFDNRQGVAALTYS